MAGLRRLVCENALDLHVTLPLPEADKCKPISKSWPTKSSWGISDTLALCWDTRSTRSCRRDRMFHRRLHVDRQESCYGTPTAALDNVEVTQWRANQYRPRTAMAVIAENKLQCLRFKLRTITCPFLAALSKTMRIEILVKIQSQSYLIIKWEWWNAGGY